HLFGLLVHSHPPSSTTTSHLSGLHSHPPSSTTTSHLSGLHSHPPSSTTTSHLSGLHSHPRSSTTTSHQPPFCVTLFPLISFKSIFMASLRDIGVSALLNIISAFVFLLAFALLRIQPINDRVYFPKWYLVGARTSPTHTANLVAKFVNLNYKTYLTFLNWMPQALRMKEPEIIDHAGLDSAAFLRIYVLGIKIFGPAAIVAFLVLIPVNVTGGLLFFLSKDLVISDIDKLSISNVQPKSPKFFAHISMMYLFTFWTCYMLYKEYDVVALMRLNFLASKSRRAEQFTVLVRNVPHVPDRSISDTVDFFFKKNHSNQYLCHETGFLGLWGKEVDSIEYYQQQIKELDEKLMMERQRIFKDPKCIMPAAFVSFNSRWGAAVCAQTQQSKNPILWLTEWAPEPRDIYWKNLAIPFVSLSIRRLVISLAVFALVFFYIIPIAFVQSLANLDGLEKVVPFLRPVIELKFIKSFLQGFLPGLALKIFLWLLPGLLMTMSKLEGHVAFSVLERRTAGKYYFFMLVNVFLGSIVTGTAFEQLDSFLHQSPTQTIGVSIPMKATFFITYIMVDGWAGMAGEILRLKPLIMFHIKNMLIVKTERDRQKAMNPKSIDFPEAIPSLQLYFLMGAVYAVVTPILLPFILIFFAFAYFVYRHQVINVYHQRYESAAAFWPHVHTRILASLLISQILLLGLLSTKKAEAVEKDTQDEASEPEIDMKSYLSEAYLHPVLRSFEEIELVEVKVDNKRAHVPSQLAIEPVSGSHSTEPASGSHSNRASPNVQHLEVVVEQHEIVYKKQHETSINVGAMHQ
ncbi:protein of unknown function DUF221, partial [Cynara cardunculus var. scolymus]